MDVIVQFSNKDQDRARQHDKVGKKKGMLKREFETLNGSLYSIPSEKIVELASDPSVDYISPDRQINASLEYSTPAVNGTIAQSYGWTGSGIGVAVIDSGVWQQHPDLPRVVYSESFHPNGNWTEDRNGHGTHVAGIIAGSGLTSQAHSSTRTFTGIAPNVNIINLRVLDEFGSGPDSAAVAAIERAIRLKRKYNIRVINLSLGRPVYDSYMKDPLCQAVEKAWKAGIVVVVAAGNHGRNNSFHTGGYGLIGSPGNDPYGITVGAVKTGATVSRADDVIASYSSKGPTAVDHVVKPDLVAPGNRVISAATAGKFAQLYPQNLVPQSYYSKRSGTKDSTFYYTLSGTSMATPVVSAAAALLLQQDSMLTPDQVKARLMKTASKSFPSQSAATDPVTGQTYLSQHDIFAVGAGYLDIWAALNHSEKATGSAVSPTAWYDAASQKVYLRPTSAEGTIWAQPNWSLAHVWGPVLFLNTGGAMWGDSAMWSDSALWSGSAMWGDCTGAGFSSLWGHSAMWGNSAMWGDSAVSSGSSGAGSGSHRLWSAMWGDFGILVDSGSSAGTEVVSVTGAASWMEDISIAIFGEN